MKERDRERAKAPARREYYRAWIIGNRDKSQSAKKAYYKRQFMRAEFRALSTVRKMLWRSVRERRSLSRLPYSIDQLMARMEAQFKPGMSWSNYGSWEIDHKVPVARFLERGEHRVEIINALSNLQPLWLSANRSKGARFAYRANRDPEKADTDILAA